MQRKDGANTTCILPPLEIAPAIKMLYKNTNTEVHSRDGDTDLFNIVIRVLQGDT